MIFFQIKESLSLLCLHIGTPNQHLTQKPVPISEIKISFRNLRKKKRKVTPSDDSWIDSFDPRPMKQRRETTVKDKLDFATKLRKIDPLSSILDFLPSSNDFDDNENSAQQPENNMSYLYVLSQATVRCMSRQILISFQKTIC